MDRLDSSSLRSSKDRLSTPEHRVTKGRQRMLVRLRTPDHRRTVVMDHRQIVVLPKSVVMRLKKTTRRMMKVKNVVGDHQMMPVRRSD